MQAGIVVACPFAAGHLGGMIFLKPALIVFAVVLLPGFCAAQTEDGNAQQQIGNSIRQYYSGLAKRDLAELRKALDDKFVIVAAARQSARTGVLDTSKPADILPKNDDWDHAEVTSVQAEVSTTHPTVAMASFTLKLPLTPNQITAMQDALKQQPDAFSQEEKRVVEKRIEDRAVITSQFAMLAFKERSWKIVSISLPH